MNQYIAHNMPENFDLLGYLHYNRSQRSFNFTDEEKFDVLESK